MDDGGEGVYVLDKVGTLWFFKIPDPGGIQIPEVRGNNRTCARNKRASL